MLHPTWNVPKPRLEEGRGGTSRVVFQVAGETCFFESRTTKLRPSMEAVLTAFLFSAMRRGADIYGNVSVCPRWRQNIETPRRLAHEWWGLRGGDLDVPVGTEGRPDPRRALFFGGGIDSFFSLRMERRTLDALVYVEGFDVPLEDEGRLAKVAALNQRIADALGLELIVLRTDLRRHPAFQKPSWTNTFGGALAAVGHLLADRAGCFLVPDDGHLVEIDPHALGIHADLTPAWSSSRVAFVHHDNKTSRLDKARTLVGWRLAEQNLRVCWEHRRADLNCGRCEKCVRTQLELRHAGGLDGFETFPEVDLDAAFEALPPFPANLRRYYDQLKLRDAR